jgi:hypothetical protein
MVKTRQQDDEYAIASKLEGLSVVVSSDLAPQGVMSMHPYVPEMFPSG